MATHDRNDNTSQFGNRSERNPDDSWRTPTDYRNDLRPDRPLDDDRSSKQSDDYRGNSQVPDYRDDTRSVNSYRAKQTFGNSDYRQSQYRPYNGASENGNQMSPSHAGKGPKGWRRSDENIREQVCDCLERDHHIDASDIEVTVNDGVVTLSGKVEHRTTKRHAEDIIENLPGVKDIRNEITVDQSFFQQAKEILTGEPAESDKSTTRTSKTARH